MNTPISTAVSNTQLTGATNFVLCPSGLWGIPEQAKALEKKILSAWVTENSVWARTIAYGELIGIPWCNNEAARWATLLLHNGILLRHTAEKEGLAILDCLPPSSSNLSELWQNIRSKFDLDLLLRDPIASAQCGFQRYVTEVGVDSVGHELETLTADAARIGWLIAGLQDDLFVGAAIAHSKRCTLPTQLLTLLLTQEAHGLLSPGQKLNAAVRFFGATYKPTTAERVGLEDAILESLREADNSTTIRNLLVQAWSHGQNAWRRNPIEARAIALVNGENRLAETFTIFAQRLSKSIRVAHCDDVIASVPLYLSETMGQFATKTCATDALYLWQVAFDYVYWAGLLNQLPTTSVDTLTDAKRKIVHPTNARELPQPPSIIQRTKPVIVRIRRTAGGQYKLDIDGRDSTGKPAGQGEPWGQSYYFVGYDYNGEWGPPRDLTVTEVAALIRARCDLQKVIPVLDKIEWFDVLAELNGLK
jgi:hypothetical protein